MMLPSFTENICTLCPKYMSHFCHLMTCMMFINHFTTGFITGVFLACNHPVVILLTASPSLCQHEAKRKAKKTSMKAALT